MICVVIEADEPARVAEGLRAAVGLGLRGERVEVLLGAAARAVVEAGAGAEVQRAMATLVAVGHVVDDAEPARVATAVRAAVAVEVWR